jgi:hypothetical protein
MVTWHVDFVDFLGVISSVGRGKIDMYNFGGNGSFLGGLSPKFPICTQQFENQNGSATADGSDQADLGRMPEPQTAAFIIKSVKMINRPKHPGTR